MLQLTMRKKPNKKQGFKFTVTRSQDTAYLRFPGTSGIKTAKNIRMYQLLPGYKGADIIFDFDENDSVVGIEVLL